MIKEKTKYFFSKRVLFLVAVLLLALILRTTDLKNNPPALYGDELTLAADTFSILKTGQDQTGKFLPLTFTASEGRPPAYVYFSIPLVAIFGPNEWGVRMLSVFSGVGIVLLTFLLTRLLISENTAKVAAVFMTISPWDIGLSRGGFEAHFALLLALLGIYLFLKARTQPGWLLLSALSFGLSIHAYHSYKVTLPAFLPLLAWFGILGKNLSGSRKYKRYFMHALVILGVLISVWLFQLGRGSDIRFLNTSIFTNPDTVASITKKINSDRTITSLPPFFISAFHNRLYEYLVMLTNNYFEHFSTDFLFLHGDKNPRHNPAAWGQFFLAESLLMIVGAAALLNRNRRLLIFLGGWILIAPLPTIVVSGAHALRSAFMLPPLIIISSFGLVYLWQNIKIKLARNIAMVLIVGTLLIQFVLLSERIFFEAPGQFAGFWGYPAKQVSQYVLSHKSEYDLIIISDRLDSIGLAYPVYAAVNPGQIIADRNIPGGPADRNFVQIDNVYLGSVPPGEITGLISRLSGRILYVGPPGDKLDGIFYQTFSGKDGLPSFITIARI